MSAQDKLNYYLNQLEKDAFLSKYPALTRLEQQTQVPKVYGVLGVASLFATLIFFNVAAGFLSTLLGWILPAYFSLKALESPGSNDDVQWLTYWTVFSAFNIFETFHGFILYWFPFYYSFKCLFITWLMLPQTRGAEVVYHKALRPLFAQTRSKVQQTSGAPTTAAAPAASHIE